MTDKHELPHFETRSLTDRRLFLKLRSFHNAVDQRCADSGMGVSLTGIDSAHTWADSIVLLFETQAQIDAWTECHRIPRGDTQPIQRVYELGAMWYLHHLDQDWHKWSTAEARATSLIEWSSRVRSGIFQAQA